MFVPLPAPPHDRIPRRPATWYLFCQASELRGTKPYARELCGIRIVIFRTARGKLGALDAACAHLGADLGRGRVEGECLRCPVHEFDFAAGGACASIPGLAGRISYPVQERYGGIFVFLGHEALFPLPGFDEFPDERVISTTPVDFTADIPWYMIASNAFDVRHFTVAHDRVLSAPIEVSNPSPFAHRSVCKFKVSGKHLVDAATRLIAGSEFTLDMTVWGGNIVLCRARFPRELTLGYVVSEPLPNGGVRVRDIPNAVRSTNPLRALLYDRIRVLLKKFALYVVMSSDHKNMDGFRYHPNGMGVGDEALAGYFSWLPSLPEAFEPPPVEIKKTGVR